MGSWRVHFALMILTYPHLFLQDAIFFAPVLYRGPNRVVRKIKVTALDHVLLAPKHCTYSLRSANPHKCGCPVGTRGALGKHSRSIAGMASYNIQAEQECD